MEWAFLNEPEVRSAAVICAGARNTKTQISIGNAQREAIFMDKHFKDGA